MSEGLMGLIGVIIGGIIASIAPTTSSIIGHLRWKREAKLEYLKSERARLQNLFTETYKRLVKAMQENSYPSDMMSDIYILMPANVSSELDKWIRNKDRTENSAKDTLMNISFEMKRSLSEIDDSIKELVSE